MLEEERKYEVDAGFALPDLTDCVPDGRPARSCARRRRCARPTTTPPTCGWPGPARRCATGGATTSRGRSSCPPTPRASATRSPAPGPPSTPPERLLDLVTAYTRGAPLAPVAVRAHRAPAPTSCCDRDDRVLVEVVDDTVTVLDGRRVPLKFREIEVERKAGRAQAARRGRGARCATPAPIAGDFTPKHVRALGLPAAATPPDWPRPPTRLPEAADAPPTWSRPRSAATSAASSTHDPLVRLRAPVRRRTTPPCTRCGSAAGGCAATCARSARCWTATWADQLRAELSWLADALGAARDAEVLRARLRAHRRRRPAGAARRGVRRPHRRRPGRPARGRAGRAGQGDALASATTALLDALRRGRPRAAADRRGASEPADDRAARAGRPAVAPARLRRQRASPAPADLDPSAPTSDWHAVRINGKRARYAVEAVAGVLGGEAAAAGQGARPRCRTCSASTRTRPSPPTPGSAIANADPDDHALAVTAGRLYERERAAVRAVRAAFPAAWRRAAAPQTDRSGCA